MYGKPQRELKAAWLTMAMLQDELNQSNNGMIILTLELESKADELARINEELKKEIMERKRAEEEHEKLLYNMGERIKELNCVYGVATSIRKRETLEEIFRDVVTLIPLAWQYPEITRVKLHFDKGEYVSEPFKETEWKQSSDIIVGGEPRGSVEVHYLESRPELDEGPFLKEERQLINGIARALSEAIERKRAEEALLKVKLGVERSGEVIFMTDPDGMITYTNPAFERIYGYTSEEALGKTPRILKSGIIPPEVYEQFWETILAKETLTGEIINKTKDGRLLDIESSVNQILDRDNNIMGFLAIQRDITERKQAEEALLKAHDELEIRVEERTADLAIANEQLQKAKEFAEVATQAKSDFLAGMSHELRTPLNAIIGFSEVLADQTFGELNQKQLKYTNNVLTSGHHLLALINDILDLSKVEAGKMELEPSMVAITSLLADSLVMIKEKALKHGISLDIRLPNELSDLKFQADERKLKQIVFNLLSNAVKFTPDGGTITVEGRQEKDELIVAVSDTGIGIKHEDLERVFGEFEQVDSTHARKQKGTGLGLALTRRLVGLHGGRIWAESEGEGKGSTFTFVIPNKKGNDKV